MVNEYARRWLDRIEADETLDADAKRTAAVLAELMDENGVFALDDPYLAWYARTGVWPDPDQEAGP
jgi:hypothetical protein